MTHADLRQSQLCEKSGCDEVVEDVNVEAFEITGKVLCQGCADEAFEADAVEDELAKVKL